MRYTRDVWIRTSRDVTFVGFDPVVFLLVPVAIVSNSWMIFYVAVVLAVIGFIAKNIFYISTITLFRRIIVKIVIRIYGSDIS